MEHTNDCCFRDIYKGGLWEEDLDVCARNARKLTNVVKSDHERRKRIKN